MSLRRLNRVPGGDGGESNSKHGPDGRSCTPWSLRGFGPPGDTLDEASSNSLEPWRAVSLMGIKYCPDGTWGQNRRTHTLVSTITT